MSATGQLHEVSVKIGELLAKVELLADANHDARRDRATLQEKLDQVVGDVRQLKTDVSEAKSDIAEMKPEGKQYNSDRNRLLGGVAVLGTAFGAFGSAALTWLKKAIDV